MMIYFKQNKKPMNMPDGDIIKSMNEIFSIFTPNITKASPNVHDNSIKRQVTRTLRALIDHGLIIDGYRELDKHLNINTDTILHKAPRSLVEIMKSISGNKTLKSLGDMLYEHDPDNHPKETTLKNWSNGTKFPNKRKTVFYIETCIRSGYAHKELSNIEVRILAELVFDTLKLQHDLEHRIQEDYGQGRCPYDIPSMTGGDDLISTKQFLYDFGSRRQSFQNIEKFANSLTRRILRDLYEISKTIR